MTQSHNDSQLFIGKSSFFFREKAVLGGNKTLNQRLGANSKKPFFAQFYSKFATFLRFCSFLAQKMLKMTISTIVSLPLSIFRCSDLVSCCISNVTRQFCLVKVTCTRRHLNVGWLSVYLTTIHHQLFFDTEREYTLFHLPVFH